MPVVQLKKTNIFDKAGTVAVDSKTASAITAAAVAGMSKPAPSAASDAIAERNATRSLAQKMQALPLSDAGALKRSADDKRLRYAPPESPATSSEEPVTQQSQHQTNVANATERAQEFTGPAPRSPSGGLTRGARK